MASVILQAGHAPWRSRSGRQYPAGGGAPGEAEWAMKLCKLIAARLEAHGVGVTVVGQWFNLPPPPEAAEPAAIFISAHFDAAIYGEGGCFADGRRYAGMPAYPGDFITGWEATYPAATGIALRTNRRNENTSLYYAYAGVTNAPAALLEHGCGSPVPVGVYPAGQDWRVLHEQIERVADADAAAIMAYLIGRGLLPDDADDGGDDVPLSAEDQAILDVMHGLNANAGSIEGWINQLGAMGDALAWYGWAFPELESQIAALRTEVGERNADVARLQAEHGRLLGDIEALQADVAALMEKLKNAPTVGVPLHVTVMTEDSRDFEGVLEEVQR